jgi:pimeloyl-ACP methyl ester carboxylesterase
MPLSMRLLTMTGVNRLLFWLQRRGDPVETARDQTAEMLVADASAVPEEFYDLFGAVRGLDDRARSLRTLVEHEGSWGRMAPVFDVGEEIVEIERPTTFLWGTEDWFWDPEVGRPVVERMADADLQVLDDHGHMPWLEPGDEVTTRVPAFLGE